MVQQDSGLRRRADDFKLYPEQTEESYAAVDRRKTSTGTRRRVPGRAFLRRYRQPIIGLSLAGAAAPLIHAGSQPEQPKTTEAQPTEADLARHAAAVAGSDAEERLAASIGAERGDAKRDAAITEAVEKYNISEDLARDIYTIAQEEGIDSDIAFGLVKTESAFKQRAVSHVGARGLTQVMPRTARWLVPGTRADDLFDRQTNLRLGFKYLNQLVDKYRGNMKNALLAYNRGPGTVDKILRRGGNPDNGYAAKVLRG